MPVFKLTNGKVEVSLISWGATITGVRVAGEDVVLGFSDMAGYTSGAGRGKNPYMGAVVGRVANRIAEAKFVLDGKEYNLAKVGSLYHLCLFSVFNLHILRTMVPMLSMVAWWVWTRSCGSPMLTKAKAQSPFPTSAGCQHNHCK